MTLTDLLHFVLQRLDLNSDEALFVSADETVGWPAGGVELLVKWGMLSPGKPRYKLLCDGCEEQCIMPVEVVQKSKQGAERAFIACDKRDDIDIVPVDPRRLLQWRIDPAQIAVRLGKLMKIDETPQMVFQDRLWRLGRARMANYWFEVFLARGLIWGDGDDLNGKLKASFPNIRSLVLVPCLRPLENTLESVATIMTIFEVLVINGDELSLDTERIEDGLSFFSRRFSTLAGQKAGSDSSESFRHSEDYSSVWFRGTKFVFTPKQRHVIQLLYEAHQNGTDELGDDYILAEIDCEGKRLRDLFKKSNAWGSLIVRGARNGTRRLNI